MSDKPRAASRRFAKSVIEIWQWGGPCQLETFDPKPGASHDYNNGLKAIPTNAGFEIHEWCPQLAQCADLYSVIRSMTHPYFAHETATYLMQTGHGPGDAVALGVKAKRPGVPGMIRTQFRAEAEIVPGVMRQVWVTPADSAEQTFAYTHLLPATSFFFYTR